MRKLLGAILSLVALAPHTSLAQPPQRGVEVRVRNERGQVETVRLYEGSYSLVIGAVNYRHWDKLGGVSDDIPAVRGALERHGFKVEELVDPTADELLPRINRFINEYGLRPNNRLVIYFSGHGYTEVAEDGRKFGYIVPVDAPKPAKDLEGFQRKALTMDEIETAARRIRSKHALFVFDSCFSGSLVNKGGVRVPPVIDYYAARPVRQFITAGADNQEVPEESVFRQVFVRGLEGQADTNRDGYITGTELAIYLQEQVIYYRGNSQTPQYGKIRDPRLDTGDFIFTLPDPASPAASPDAQHYFKRGLERYKALDFDQAIANATEAIRLNPAFAEAYTLRGVSYYQKNNFDQAIADCTQAIKFEPQNYLPYSYLARVYFKRKDYDQTIANSTQAIQLNPKDKLAYFFRASAFLLKDDYDRAIADSTQVIAFDPKDADAYAIRATSYRNKGDNERAIADFTEAIKSGDSMAATYYHGRAVAHFNKRDYDSAVADYTEAIRLEPGDASHYKGRGKAYYRKKNHEAAVADYTQAIRLGLKDADTYTDRALAYHSKQSHDEAIADFTESLRLDAKNAQIYILRGINYFKKDRCADAIKDYTEAIRIDPDDEDPYVFRAQCYDKIGDGEKAAADRRKANSLKK